MDNIVYFIGNFIQVNKIMNCKFDKNYKHEKCKTNTRKN